MEALQIKPKNARNAYRLADAKTKAVLEELFGKENLQPGSITEEIKTFEDACEAMNMDPSKVFSAGDTDDEIAYKKIKIIALALNEGWTPDWNNSNQWKYYPYFKKNASGVGFSYDDCAYVTSGSTVGSRSVFETAAQARYAGETFLELYREVHLFEK